jgi:hypothetical protein
MNSYKEFYNKNIDEYNQNYNMNYCNNKVYYSDDFKNMNQTIATVISDPQINYFRIGDMLIEIYNYKINYKAINYIYEKPEDFTHSFLFDGIPTVYMTKKVDIPFPDTINVTTNIITTSRLEKNDFIYVYYNYGSIGRFAPPFLPEKYIKYFDKIK